MTVFHETGSGDLRGALARCADTVRRLPLRCDADDRGEPPEKILASGWLAGPSECARLFGMLVGAQPTPAAAFGGPWWVVETPSAAVAPAIPTQVDETENTGPDGVYRRYPSTIHREAGGWVSTVVDWGSGTAAADGSSAGPQLIWFDETSRYLLCDGVLEIEDLFSRVTLPGRPRDIDRLLIRGRGAPPEVARGLPEPDSQCPVAVELRRSLALVGDVPWHDPVAILRCRPGTDAITRHENRLSLVGGDRQPVELVVTEGAEGWSARAQRDDSAIRTTSLRRVDDNIVYRVELAPNVDLLGGGLRQRIAFDLMSDLVTLSASRQKT